jgi:hypothetical protein
MRSFQKLVALEFSGNMIDVFALGVVVDHSSPLVKFVLFSICNSFGDEDRQSLKRCVRHYALAGIEGTSRISILLSLIFEFPLLFIYLRISSLVQMRADDEIMEDAILFGFPFSFLDCWLGGQFGKKGLTFIHCV